MDYALVHSLQHKVNPAQQVIHFYDVNCQYNKNLHRRIANNQFISLPPDLKIVPGIGIWHVHGHQMQCFVWYAPNFIPGAGNVDGEIMETLWSSVMPVTTNHIQDQRICPRAWSHSPCVCYRSPRSLARHHYATPMSYSTISRPHNPTQNNTRPHLNEHSHT